MACQATRNSSLFLSCVRFARWLVLLSLCEAAAQDASTGALRGTVVDASGSRIANAGITMVCGPTGFRYSAVSDTNGRFTFELLPPGDYSARATAVGMSPQVTSTLHVPVGGVVEIEFKLVVAGAQETVNVSGAPPLVETQPTAVSSFIETRAIEELPLDGRRFTDLALMTPGVTQDPRGMTSASNGDLAFGGIRGTSPAIWWMELTTTMLSSLRQGDVIARPVSFLTRSCRSSAFPRTPTERNWDGRVAR